jgi:hypothetical protein
MGGGPSIPKQHIGQNLNQIFSAFQGKELPAFSSFVQGQPLLQQSQDFALNQLKNVGQLTGPLQQLLGGLPNISNLTDPLQQQLSGLPSSSSLAAPLQQQEGIFGQQERGLQQQIRNMPNIAGLTNPLSGMLNSLRGVYANQIQPTLRSGGALTPEQAQQVQQQTYNQFAQLGNLRGNQAIGTELLNRSQYQQQRFQDALNQATGISSQEQGLTSGIEGLRTQDIQNRLGLSQGIQSFGQGIAGLSQGIQDIYGKGAQQRLDLTKGIQGLTASDAALRMGLTQGIQGIGQTALQEATGTEQAETGAFGNLLNPLMSAVAGMQQANQNAGAAQSVGAANKAAGGESAGASILAAAAPALIGL